MANTVELLLSLLTIGGQVFLVLLLALRLFSWKAKWMKSIKDFFGKNGLLFALIISLSSIIGSLYFSIILEYPPCELCWYQRVFMYPIAFVILASMIFKKKDASLYSIVLASVGFLVSLYHVIILNLPNVVEICAVGEVSCLTEYFTYFGYVTIPVMSLTGFLMIIVFCLLSWKK